MRNPFIAMAVAAATMAAKFRGEIAQDQRRIALPSRGFRYGRSRSKGDPMPAGNKLIRAHQRSGSVYGMKGRG